MTGTNLEPIEFEQSSGNVFADLGFTDSDVELARAEICRQITHEIKSRRLPQARAAVLLGIDQPRVSLIVRGHTEDFSLERLLELLRHFDYTIDIRLSKVATAEAGTLRVSIAA